MNASRHFAVLVAAVLCAGWLAGTARADFTLYGNEQLTVNTFHQQGWLYDQSKAWLVSGGEVNSLLRTYDDSTVDMSDGRIGFLETYGNSTVDISGGSLGIFTHDGSRVTVTGGSVKTVYTSGHSSVDFACGPSGSADVGIVFVNDASTLTLSAGHLGSRIMAFDDSDVRITGGSVDDRVSAEDNATMTISGGDLYCLETWHDSVVDLSGGSVDFIRAHGGNMTIHGKDFILVGGLLLEGDRVLGTGVLSGKWFDGTAWAIPIPVHEAGATILAVPEPATLALLALLALSLPKRGGLAMLKRKRKS